MSGLRGSGAAAVGRAELTRRALVSFETEPCGRCGGSGLYSYCDLWGHTCFQCGYAKGVPGVGRRLTKRGKIAKAHFLASFPRKAARHLQPGDMFVRDGRVLTVVSVRPSTSAVVINGERVSAGLLDIDTPGLRIALVREDSEFSLAPKPEDVERAVSDALAFQATLTKQGKPRVVPGLRGDR